MLQPAFHRYWRRIRTPNGFWRVSWKGSRSGDESNLELVRLCGMVPGCTLNGTKAPISYRVFFREWENAQ